MWRMKNYDIKKNCKITTKNNTKNIKKMNYGIKNELQLFYNLDYRNWQNSTKKCQNLIAALNRITARTFDW